ncbi:MAG: hypothetical protein ACKV2U_20660 [Bryobacteraceae bacterium]
MSWPLLFVPVIHAQVTYTTKSPPNRGGSFDAWCPPNGVSATGAKTAPDATKGDKDVAGDGKLDYYMGEWKYVERGRNVIVRKWCINADPTDNGPGKTPRFTFNDFFSFEIFTSIGATETQRVAPGSPT